MKELVLGVVSHNFRRNSLTVLMKWWSSIRWVNSNCLDCADSVETSVQTSGRTWYEIHISDEALKLLSENGYDPSMVHVL